MGGTNGKAAKDLPRLAMLQSATRYHGQNWFGLKDREAYAVRGVPYTPLLAGFLALALFLGIIILTWNRESR